MSLPADMVVLILRGWKDVGQKVRTSRCMQIGAKFAWKLHADYPRVWQEIKAMAVRPAAGKRLVEEEIIISASESPHLYDTFHWRLQVQRKPPQTPVNHWRKRWPDGLHKAC